MALYEHEIHEIFSFHPPKNEDVAKAHERVRLICKDAALEFTGLCPSSAEQTLAIRHLQQAMMYANAAIAIHS